MLIYIYTIQLCPMYFFCSSTGKEALSSSFKMISEEIYA